MHNFIPEDMKEPKWLAPLCVLTFTIGVFLLTVLATELAPEIRERAAARGLTQVIIAIAIVNIVNPVAVLLYYSSSQTRLR